MMPKNLNVEYREILENFQIISRLGARGSVVVKALCYKPEGHGFDTDAVNF
jgi:hypothetical protein